MNIEDFIAEQKRIIALLYALIDLHRENIAYAIELQNGDRIVKLCLTGK